VAHDPLGLKVFNMYYEYLDELAFNHTQDTSSIVRNEFCCQVEVEEHVVSVQLSYHYSGFIGKVELFLLHRYCFTVK